MIYRDITATHNEIKHCKRISKKPYLNGVLKKNADSILDSPTTQPFRRSNTKKSLNLS